MARSRRAAHARQPRRFLRRPAVLDLTGLSRSTLYALMADGLFPRPIKIGKAAVGWLETDIAAWQQARIDDREWRARGAPSRQPRESAS